MSQRKLGWGFLGLAMLLSSAPARAADVDKYLPSDANGVIYVNLRQAIDSPLVKKFFLKQAEDALKNNRQAQDLLKALDLDPFKDIDSFLAAGQMESLQENKNAVMVVRGKFNTEKILATAREVARTQGGIKVTTIGGKTVIEGGQGDRTVYGTFLDGKTLLISPSKDVLESAVDGKATKPNKELANLIGSVDNKQTFWLAVVMPEAIRKRLAMGEGPQATIGAKVKSAVLGVTVTKDVGVSVRIETADAETAKELANTINQFKGLLKFLGQSEARLEPLTAEIIKTLRVEEGDSRVNLSFKLSEGTVEKLIKSFDLPAIP